MLYGFRFVFIGLFAALTAFSSDGFADSDGKAGVSGNVSVSGAWARVLLASRPGAVFLKIENGGTADRLIAATSPSAQRVELHTHIEKDGVFRMRPVDAMEVPENGTLELKSGGNHIMLFGLDEHVKAKGHIPLTLIFEKAGKVNITAPLRKGNGGHEEHSGSDGHSGHGSD